MKVVEKPGYYLGADMDLSKRKGDLFSKVIQRFRDRLGG